MHPNEKLDTLDSKNIKLLLIALFSYHNKMLYPHYRGGITRPFIKALEKK